MSEKPVVALIEGDDDSQRFFNEDGVRRKLTAVELEWWATAKPGDMYRVKNGGYFPNTDSVIIKLGEITEMRSRR